ncbi:MAG TPA: hypothetical protein VF789_19850 [Thermoanaerobaculia bacterium]
MKELSGFLFSKLGRINSRSEGPDYFLQQFDRSARPIAEKVIPVHKEAPLFKEDPVLQKCLAMEVTVSGRIVDGCLHYKEIHPVNVVAAVT